VGGRGRQRRPGPRGDVEVGTCREEREKGEEGKSRKKGVRRWCGGAPVGEARGRDSGEAQLSADASPPPSPPLHGPPAPHSGPTQPRRRRPEPEGVRGVPLRSAGAAARVRGGGRGRTSTRRPRVAAGCPARAASSRASACDRAALSGTWSAARSSPNAARPLSPGASTASTMPAWAAPPGGAAMPTSPLPPPLPPDCLVSPEVPRSP